MRIISSLKHLRGACYLYHTCLSLCSSHLQGLLAIKTEKTCSAFLFKQILRYLKQQLLCLNIECQDFFLNDRKICFELVSFCMAFGSMKVRVVWDEGMASKQSLWQVTDIIKCKDRKWHMTSSDLCILSPQLKKIN